MSKKTIYICDICSKQCCMPAIGKGLGYGSFSEINFWETLSGNGIVVGARVALNLEGRKEPCGYDAVHACTRCTIKSLKAAIQDLEDAEVEEVGSE